MKLEIESTRGFSLPPLGWVAKYEPDTPESLRVWCGELVEVGKDYAVEGVWPGPFEELAFDSSELFYGSGLRVVGNAVRFVGSCSTVDRIWCHDDAGTITVSNSLPCLLRIANADLIHDDNSYARAVETIVKGRAYQKLYPISKGSLRVHYFENLELRDRSVFEASKNTHVDSFPDFESYQAFLFQTADKIGQNARDPGRNHPVNVVSTISKGYDSPVASILAKRAGAEKAFTITSARSLLPRKDSGAKIAKQINLHCEEYSSKRKNFRDELWYWAANGSLQDMNFSLFDYPRGPSVMFTGFNGDMVWSRSSGVVPEDHLKRKDSTGLGFCEHRLLKGVIHCPVPFWGIRNLADMKRISEDEEMKPWSVGGDYDRPIPRRISEEAGISRELFGHTKSATTIDELLLLPLSSELYVDYKQYLKLEGKSFPMLFSALISRVPMRFLIDIYRTAFRQRLINQAFRVFGFSKWSRNFPWENYLFTWANSELKKRISM